MRIIIQQGDNILISDENKEVQYDIEYVDESSGEFAIYAPPGEFYSGKQYHLSITRPGEVYSGVGVVKKAEKPSDPQITGLEYLFSITKPIRKIQNRHAVRHDCFLPVLIKPYKSEDYSGKDVYEGVITNISAGGMKVVSNFRIMRNSLLKFATSLNKTLLEVDGVILDITTMDKSVSAYKFSMRIKFKDVKARAEEIIVRYIFEEYRKKKTKEIVNKENE